MHWHARIIATKFAHDATTRTRIVNISGVPFCSMACDVGVQIAMRTLEA